MATASSNQLYPMSTEKGEYIPLDIIRPKGAFIASFVADLATSVVIPAGYSEVSIRSTVDCIIDFDDLATFPVSGAYDSAMILYADMVETIQLPSTGSVSVVPLKATEAGSLYINAIQKWAGIGLERQLVRR